MSEIIYNQIYYLGLQTIRYGKRFFRWLWALMLKPVKAISTLLFTIIIVIDKFALKTFHEIVGDFRELVSDVKKVSFKTATDNEENKKNKIKRFGTYVKIAYRKYKKVFLYAFNIILPILSFCLLLNIASAWADTTFALEINYNDQIIGYVRSEADYKEARELAFDRLDITASNMIADNNQEKELIGKADYKIKPVKLSQISNSYEICDKLIANSDSKITNACGIYVDGSFICALKNETDAISVFDSILAQHETGEENAVVSFVEEIEYVQGLYPDNDNTVKDASYLSEKLNSKKSEARHYIVQAGDTVSQIAQKFNMTTTQLFNLNPELKENIYIGQKVLLANEVNFIRVQITKTETKQVEIPFETVKVNTNSLYKGDQKTVVKGVKGLEEVTELVTYIDGVRVSSKEVSRTTIREAVDEKIQVGTKQNSSTSGNIVSYGRFVWPTIGANRVSSYYGKRSLNGWHGGIDIVKHGGKSTGVPVVAAESGRVTLAKYNGSYGYCVIIDHGNGLSTLYAHMKPGSLRVSAGEYVTRGQQVGQIGATGFVTGPHLHFEVRVNGNRVDPAPYLGIKTGINE